MATPPDGSARLDEAKQHLRQKQPEKAIELFEQALEQDGANSEVLEGLGAAYYQAGNLQSAAEYFRRLADYHPRNGRAYINLGAIYNRLGEHRQAADALRRGIQKETRCAEGYYNLGIAERKLGNMNLAISAYREAIRLNPQMPEAHQNLANLYLEMGQTQQASLYYRRALDINPKFEKARRGLQEAERAELASRKSVGIFGRLVDEGSQQEGDAVGRRAMSTDQRRQDREHLAALVADIEAAATACLAQLKRLEPALLDVARAVAQPDVAGLQLWTVFSEFRSAVESMGECRRELLGRMQLLRDHEGAIASAASAVETQPG